MAMDRSHSLKIMDRCDMMEDEGREHQATTEEEEEEEEGGFT